MPFSHFENSLKRAIKGYPKELLTIGDHLRKRRLDLKLLQEEVALIVKVSTDTITNWENNHTQPMVYQTPAVIQFLGYNPYSFGVSKVGDKVKGYRYLHGLSHKKLGKLVGVDASTVGSWESEESSPCQKTIKHLERLLIL